jgi:hypothetical protein
MAGDDNSYSKYNPKMKLTPTELLEISREINQEFAPVFSVKKPEPAGQDALSPQAMLEISEEIRQDFAPKASDKTPKLVLLPVDPEHLYAYWNLGEDKLNAPQKNTADPLTLRIYPASDKNAAITKPWFDVAVADSRAQQPVFLSMQTHAAAYRATLGNRHHDNSLAPLAYSNVTPIPRGKAQPNHIKDNQPVFKAMPPFVKTGTGAASYRHSSASGQSINE